MTERRISHRVHHDAMWWIGQVVAVLIALALLLDGYGWPVALAAGYAMEVLVDIREAVRSARCALQEDGQKPQGAGGAT